MEILLFKEPLRELESFFKDDTEVSLILDGTKIGMNGPEIISKLGLNKKDFEAADRRLRRKITEIESIELSLLSLPFERSEK